MRKLINKPIVWLIVILFYLIVFVQVSHYGWQFYPIWNGDAQAWDYTPYELRDPDVIDPPPNAQ